MDASKKPQQDLMMKVAFIVRSTLFTVRGGDTVQVVETARALGSLGISVTIKLAHEKVDYHAYGLLHFFNITRPADILMHVKRSKKPFVITPIWIDYSIYDKYQRTGLAGRIFRFLSPDTIEYIKTIGRFVKGKDKLVSRGFIWSGQRRSIQYLLRKVSCLLVNSENEYADIGRRYKVLSKFEVVPNGIHENWLEEKTMISRDPNLVLCVARIEGLKNQLNLVKAISNTHYHLVLIGEAAPNQRKYYEHCKKIAGPNVEFKGWLDAAALERYYAKAKVHVLPGFFELCGLASLEAAAMGCSVVVGHAGYARDYFEEQAFYCDPADIASIREAIDAAAMATAASSLQEKIRLQYNWPQAAKKILATYKKIII